MNILSNKKTISVSILDAENINEFLLTLKNIKEKLKLDNVIIHFDVMDGIFVPNIGVDLNNIKLARQYGFFTDVHLMVASPEDWIKKADEFGADNITIHYEIDEFYKNLKLLNEIKKKRGNGFSIGISIKPETAIESVINYTDMFDLLLIMSVEPGYGKQKYIENVNNKISAAKSIDKALQIDGGINDETIETPLKLGINSFVIGSYFTKDLNLIDEKILKIEDIIEGK